MRIFKILLFFFGVSVVAQNTALSPQQEASFKNQVISQSASISSFSAEFTQIKHMSVMSESPQSSGKVYYQAPNMLKWEYIKPYHYQILFKDAKLYIMEDGLLSEIDLSSNKIFEKMGELVAGSLNGKILQADKDFHIAYYHYGSNIRARIIPKDEKLRGMFKEIWVNFNSQFLINAVRLIDPSGDFTEISMRNISINKPISASVFQK